MRAEMETKQSSEKLFQRFSEEFERLKKHNSNTETLKKRLEDQLQTVAEKSEKLTLENVQLRNENMVLDEELKRTKNVAKELQHLKEENTRTSVLTFNLENQLRAFKDCKMKQECDITKLKTEKILLEKNLVHLQKQIEEMEKKLNKEVNSISTQATPPEPKFDKEKICRLLKELWVCVDPPSSHLPVLEDSVMTSSHHADSSSVHPVGGLCGQPHPPVLREHVVQSSPSTSVILSPLPQNIHTIDSLRDTKCSARKNNMSQVHLHGWAQPRKNNTSQKHLHDRAQPSCGDRRKNDLGLDSKHADVQEILDWFKPLPPVLSPMPCSAHEGLDDVLDSGAGEQTSALQKGNNYSVSTTVCSTVTQPGTLNPTEGQPEPANQNSLHLTGSLSQFVHALPGQQCGDSLVQRSSNRTLSQLPIYGIPDATPSLSNEISVQRKSRDYGIEEKNRDAVLGIEASCGGSVTEQEDMQAESAVETMCPSTGVNLSTNVDQTTFTQVRDLIPNSLTSPDSLSVHSCNLQSSQMNREEVIEASTDLTVMDIETSSCDITVPNVDNGPELERTALRSAVPHITNVLDPQPTTHTVMTSMESNVTYLGDEFEMTHFKGSEGLKLRYQALSEGSQSSPQTDSSNVVSTGGAVSKDLNPSTSPSSSQAKDHTYLSSQVEDHTQSSQVEVPTPSALHAEVHTPLLSQAEDHIPSALQKEDHSPAAQTHGLLTDVERRNHDVDLEKEVLSINNSSVNQSETSTTKLEATSLVELSTKNAPVLGEFTPGPVEDTPGPVEDTPGPVEDTPGPVEDTPGPVEDTPGPVEDTPGPVEDTPGPVEDTPGPVEDTPGPVEDTPGPVEDTPGPVEDTPGPVEDTPGPVEDTPGPVEDTTGPVEDTPGPVEDTTGPVEDTTGPGDVKPGPGDVKPGPDEFTTSVHNIQQSNETDQEEIPLLPKSDEKLFTAKSGKDGAESLHRKPYVHNTVSYTVDCTGRLKHIRLGHSLVPASSAEQKSLTHFGINVSESGSEKHVENCTMTHGLQGEMEATHLDSKVVKDHIVSKSLDSSIFSPVSNVKLLGCDTELKKIKLRNLDEDLRSDVKNSLPPNRLQNIEPLNNPISLQEQQDIKIECISEKTTTQYDISTPSFEFQQTEEISEEPSGIQLCEMFSTRRGHVRTSLVKSNTNRSSSIKAMSVPRKIQQLAVNSSKMLINKVSPDVGRDGSTTVAICLGKSPVDTGLGKVRSEMGPPLPALLMPLTVTPPRPVKPVKPAIRRQDTRKRCLSSTMEGTISPGGTETAANDQKWKSPTQVTIAPSSGVPSFPLQFGSATPKHAVPVPGRLPACSSSSSSPVQENSMTILDSMYPELSARARTLSILRGNLSLSTADSGSTSISQPSGFKTINSLSTAFSKTDQIGKRSDVNMVLPKSAKRLRLDNSSPSPAAASGMSFTSSTSPVDKGLSSPSSGSPDTVTWKPQEVINLEKVTPAWKPMDKAPTFQHIKPVCTDSISQALEKISAHCFDLLPVIRSHLCVGNLSRKPVLRDEEKEVIAEFTISKSVGDDLMAAMVTKLKAERSVMGGTQLQALVRVYTALCRQGGHWDRAHILAYSILKEDFPESDKLILFMVTTWPSVFSCRTVLCQAIHTVTKLRAEGEVFHCLTAYMDWEKAPPTDLGLMVSTTLTCIKEADKMSFQKHPRQGQDLNPVAWQHIFTLDLLCFQAHWTWTFDNVLSPELWPMMNSWLTQPRSGPMPIKDVTMAAGLRLIGRLGQLGIKERCDSVRNIASVINTFTRQGQSEGVPWEVQLAAIYTVYDLSPCNPKEALAALASWRQETTQTVPPAVTSCITQIASLCRHIQP
ncbi:hypothetical protein UPYG_G00304180 [Umbra pygmaea]|uniref:Little elongation complex subunit 1 C-terminal domain-containing protein n=1 Tax=Umbra pygmaea TaxID=75934 RepID=A0ABD0W2Y0_UMBPY